jgi:hypothetical protein
MNSQPEPRHAGFNTALVEHIFQPPERDTRTVFVQAPIQGVRQWMRRQYSLRGIGRLMSCFSRTTMGHSKLSSIAAGPRLNLNASFPSQPRELPADMTRIIVAVTRAQANDV